ncbi:hypothetical protein AB0E55_22865 [Amycolatopsis keratiniphila]|uniref:hypothetical protein n=1 Tax=Amycolatopsis keratiniphila TaxID=129921 RepID=UPI0033C52D22
MDNARTRHQDYTAERDRLLALWERGVAGPDGPLAGAILDPAPLPTGWCGQVQLVPGEHHIGDVRDAEDFIAAIYGLQRGAVVVEDSRTGTADTAFVWAFHTVSAADHYRHTPMTTLDVYGRADAPASTTADPGELKHLADWADKHRFVWDQLRAGEHRHVDVDRVVHRLQRLRGGILDLLPRTAPGQVRAVLEDAGVTREHLPDDLADLVGLPQR